MTLKPKTTLITTLTLTTLILIYLNSTLLSFTSLNPTKYPNFTIPKPHNPHCNLFKGHWIHDPTQKPIYNDTCPFHRNAWNCLRNRREKMDVINSWRWVPQNCSLRKIDAIEFMGIMRNKKVGFVGDSLNENFIASFLCILRSVDGGAKKWKKKGAWKGGYFPKFNVTVAYHRAVLLAKYQEMSREESICCKLIKHEPANWWQENKPNLNGVKGIYRVDVDIPAREWVQITKFYDVLVFNTGHWWGPHKFPKETPLVFYHGGKPIVPALDFLEGFKVVLKNMITYIEKEVPASTLKFWRLQSPRHFFGGEWNQNGSCVFDEPLKEPQLDLWFDPSNNGVNKEARQLNQLIEEALQGSSIQKLDLTHLSEFRADAHPAIWLGRKDAVAVWGQDCMHWCLPGVPDTWVDILSELILYNFRDGSPSTE